MSVWNQSEYNSPLAGQQASKGCERQPSVCARSIWMTLYNEHLKGSAKVLKDVWNQLLNQFLITLSIPNRWRKSIVRVLYKGKGDAEDPNAYRDIALECAPFKILTKLLTERLTNLIDCSIPEEQFGFRRGRSTLQAIQCLQRDVEDALTQQNGKLYSILYLSTIPKPSIP